MTALRLWTKLCIGTKLSASTTRHMICYEPRIWLTHVPTWHHASISQRWKRWHSSILLRSGSRNIPCWCEVPPTWGDFTPPCKKDGCSLGSMVWLRHYLRCWLTSSKTPSHLIYWNWILLWTVQICGPIGCHLWYTYYFGFCTWDDILLSRPFNSSQFQGR